MFCDKPRALQRLAGSDVGDITARDRPSAEFQLTADDMRNQRGTISASPLVWRNPHAHIDVVASRNDLHCQPTSDELPIALGDEQSTMVNILV